MLAGLILSVTASSFAQKPKTDANIVGHVTNNGSHLPYANISLKGTTIGTLADETDHFQLVNCPPGTYLLVANSLGYKTQEKSVLV